MLKNFLEDFLEMIKSRTFILGVVFVVMIGVLFHRVFELQIVNGEDYLNRFTYRIQKETELQSPRGTIYDCNGEPLAYNQLSYSVIIEDSPQLSDNQTRNTMVANLIEIIESTGNELLYDIPLEQDENGNIVFTAGENTILRFKKDVYSTENLSEEQINATAEEVYTYMRSKSLFNLDTSYDTADALKILSVRFDIYMKRYEKYLSVTVATDVNDELVAAVKENSDILPGVTISQDYTRIYADSKYFSNITGYIGSISEDELAKYEEEGNDNYSQNDQIGKTGIESYYESVLKGTKGSQTLYVNSLGSVLEEAERVDPVPGEDIYLTIDKDLQMAAYDMLEERIAGILLAYMTEDDITDDGSDILIPIKEFYYALIDNNVISLSHLSAENATSEEKDFWQKYLNYEASITNSLNDKMGITLKKLDEEYESYLLMAYSMLKNDGLLNTASLDDNDETLSDWNAGRISFSELIHYAISKDIIDITALNLTSDYLDTNEIYAAVIDYISENLPAYEGFEKKVYYYMLENDYISGRDICLLLYAQGVLEEDDDYTALKSGELSAYRFMYNKIYYMEITPDMLALPPCSGSFIITDINTGEVKALVSYPGYDANQINNVSYFASLVNNDSSPFYNRATQQATAPGSTFKIISAIAGLEEGVIDISTEIRDDVEFDKVEPHANCWNSSGHGTINIEEAIMYSCNYFFYELGYRLGTQTTTVLSDSKGLAVLSKYTSMFGLNSVTGIELPETEPTISTESVVRSAIGQGTNNYTPAQLVRYIAAVANSGSLYELTLLDKITDSQGNIVEENEPVLTNTIDLDQETWDIVHKGMYLVCNKSSYRTKMGNLGVTLAGKSGTAQESEKLPNHGLFVGYAPYENPEVAAVVTIPNGHGSSNVLDLYAELMCYYFNVPYDKDDDTTETTSSVRTANIPERDIEAD